MEKTVRTYLIEERKRNHWSQQEVADLIGTTQNNVSRWELGITTPGSYFCTKLCKLFGKQPWELGLFGDQMDEEPLPTRARTLHIPNTSLPAPDQPLPLWPVPYSLDNLAVLSRKQEKTNSTAPEVAALWTVPYPRNPYFTGRDDLFDQLDQHFSPREPDDLATPRRAALTQPQAIKGLGGVGKTQIAIEYAYRVVEQGRYTHVFWINAGSSETLLTSFMTLAELLPAFPAKEEKDQRKLVAEIKRWLEQCQHRWVLIVDNVDDLSLIQEYLPQQGSGSILITTRANAVGSLAASLEVGQMGLMEGTQFLLHRVRRLGAVDEESNEAINVVIALDGFPLALDQAGAYIEETGCSFGDYLQLYQDHREVLLARRGMQTTNYPDSVATTWSLSFQKVEQDAPAAVELLRLCAFLAPDHIPEELVTGGAAHWPSALQHAATDLLAFNHLFKELLKFSLVKRLIDNHLFSIHRLVQSVQMDLMGPEERLHWAERVVRAVNVVFPDTVEVATWPRCQRYLSQAQACSALTQDYALTFAEAASLLSRTAHYLQDFAFYEQAELLFQRALHIWEQTLEPDSIKMARSLNRLAKLYQEQGKYQQAEPLYQRAMRIQEHILGSDHPEMARSLDNLATLYRGQGKYQQAESLHQRAVCLQEHILGPNHPEVAQSLHNLARLLSRQGKYQEAEPLFQRALHIREQTLAPDHPEVAESFNSLAVLYARQRKYQEAEPLFQRVLHIWEQALGADHPKVAISLHNLAELSANQSKYREAEPLYQRALRIWERALGPDHLDVAYALHGLADLYAAQSRYEEAELRYRRVLSIRERTLGEQHLDTAQILYDFAVLREAQEQYQEAAFLYQRAQAIYERVYGSQHSRTIETHTRWCAVLLALERPKEVEKGTEVGGELRSVLPACPYCQSASTVAKSGTNTSGSLRFRCSLCRRYFTPQAAPRGYDRTRKQQAVLLARQGKSYRFIARQLGTNHRTISTWVKAESQG